MMGMAAVDRPVQRRRADPVEPRRSGLAGGVPADAAGLRRDAGAGFEDRAENRRRRQCAPRSRRRGADLWHWRASWCRFPRDASRAGRPGCSLCSRCAPFLASRFLRYEAPPGRAGGMPLVDIALLRIPSFRRGVLVAALFFLTTSFYLLFGLYQQEGRGRAAAADRPRDRALRRRPVPGTAGHRAAGQAAAEAAGDRHGHAGDLLCR